MILEMKVPSPGESISEVEIANWLVQTGDYVEKDQEIAEVDSDKATLALPAEASGVIELLVEPGTTVAVGQVVAKIDTLPPHLRAAPNRPQLPQLLLQLLPQPLPTPCPFPTPPEPRRPRRRKFWRKKAWTPPPWWAPAAMAALPNRMP